MKRIKKFGDKDSKMIHGYFSIYNETFFFNFKFKECRGYLLNDYYYTLIFSRNFRVVTRLGQVLGNIINIERSIKSRY